jgi:hypothetical protein
MTATYANRRNNLALTGSVPGKTTVMAIAASFVCGALQGVQSPMDAMIGGDQGILEPDDLAGCSIPLIFEKSEPATVTLPRPLNTGEHHAITGSPVGYSSVRFGVRRTPRVRLPLRESRKAAGEFEADLSATMRVEGGETGRRRTWSFAQ